MVKKGKPPLRPLVSICTPTFNRRPFFPFIIKCFENQDYPKDRLEWIIIDDGTDPIEDLVAGIPKVKYFGYKKKMSLGEKRNLMHEKATGSILVYMDDDDYYPPKRVETAVAKLNNSTKQIAGCSYAYMYHYNLEKLYKFKSFGRNHSTNNCFAYKKEYLLTHRHDAGLDLGEEMSFTNSFTEPMIQLDSEDCIVISSHSSNTFDKTPLCIKENNQIREILNNNIILPEIILKIKEALF